MVNMLTLKVLWGVANHSSGFVDALLADLIASGRRKVRMRDRVRGGPGSG